MDAFSRTARPQPPSFAVQALHVYVLTALAISARLYVVLGNHPAFFMNRRTDVLDVLLLVCAVSVLLPGLLAALDWMAGWFGPRPRGVAHTALVFALTSAAALPLCKLFGGGASRTIVAAALATGTAATVVYHRLSWARMAVTILGPLVLLSPAVFLLGSRASATLLCRSDPKPLDVRVGNPVPVVLVVLDELSGITLLGEDREIDAVRWPHFAALAKESVWFRNATTVSNSTDSSLPAILTGNYPLPDVPEPDGRDHPDNLFTLLAKSHELVVREPLLSWCPEDWWDRRKAPLGRRLSSLMVDAGAVGLAILLPPDWPIPQADLDGRWGNFLDRDVEDDAAPNPLVRRREVFEEFIAAIRPGQRPGLYFLHVELPHVPWSYLPSGKEYPLAPVVALQHAADVADGAVGLNRQTHVWAGDETAVVQAQYRYLLQVGFVDHMLGRLVEHLRQIGLYDRALIIITADHGISFLADQPPRRITPETCPEIMSVPLVVKLPGRSSGRTSDRNVESIDILPTIAGVLQVEPPWTPDGESLLSDRPERPTKKIVTPESQEPWRVCDARLAEKEAPLREMLRRFGSGSRLDDLAPLGPHRDLIGRRLSDCRVDDQPQGAVELFETEGLSRLAADGPVLPCYLGGRVWPGPEAHLPLDLAIAVGGTIRAVSRTFAIRGLEDVWTAVVPEAAWQQEASGDVGVFAVAGQGKELRLCPLSIRRP